MDADATPPEDPRARRSARIKLLALAAFFLLPVAASYLAYSWWTPTPGANHGELIAPALVEDAAVAALKGKWVLVQFDSGACDAHCESKQYLIRQARRALGKDQSRVERLWLVTDAVAPRQALLDAIAGTHVAPATPRLAGQFSAAGSSVVDCIYVVDPLGNLMMRFPRQPDPARLVKDLQRLLRASRIG